MSRRDARPATVPVVDLERPVTETQARRWMRHKTGQGQRCRWSSHAYVGPECPCPDGCEAS